MSTTQKTVIVTGASQGIGAAVANLFLERGYNVVANSRRISEKNELRRSDALAVVDGDIALPATADTLVATRDDFLANVSHDLRSLLAGLSLSAQVLLDKAPPGASGDLTRKCANTSQRLVARMSRLVNDLLDVASIEAGKVALLIEESDVADILRDTLEAFEPLAAVRGISLSAEAERVPCVGRFDSGRILEVLANLVSNALKFTAAGGRVSIQVARDGNELRFAVKDTGIGIPRDALAGVFDKFKQVAKDRRGLGLGLYISKGIVEAHGGRMWGESEVGSGSTFHFVIPSVLPSH